jgi:prepilin-type N-terminal cleavage/methylation domain-containing protein
MINKKHPVPTGFTLVEITIAMVVMVITAASISTILVNNLTGWSRLYDSAYSDVMVDGYVAKNKFETVIRKASSTNISLDDNGAWAEVYSYNSTFSYIPDRYALFYTSGKDLKLEQGQLNPKTRLNVETVCTNISQCKFSRTGSSVQMELKLDSGTQTNTVLISAVPQNH